MNTDIEFARSAVLKVNDTLRCTVLDSELILYEDTSGSVFHLNQVASLIFCACDGCSTFEDILQVLLDTFGGQDAERMKKDLSEIVEDFKENKIIIE